MAFVTFGYSFDTSCHIEKRGPGLGCDIMKSSKPTSQGAQALVVAHLFLGACNLDQDRGDTDRGPEPCAEPNAKNPEEAIAHYLGAWEETEPKVRACRLFPSLSEHVSLVSGRASVAGRREVGLALDEEIARQLDRGALRTTVGPLAFRHAEVRLHWTTTDDAGVALDEGEDWIEFGSDGLVSALHLLEGEGTTAPTHGALMQWQNAWNTRNDTLRAEALEAAVTETIHFTNTLVEVYGRDALNVEIGRQQDGLDARLTLDEDMQVFATDETGEPVLVRVGGYLTLGERATLPVVDYARIVDGRIERFSGFSTP